MNSDTSGIVLTAAKADVTVCEVFGDLPTALIPINGKPIIFFILQQFLDHNINDVYVGVDYKSDKLKELLNLHFGSKLNINYIYTSKDKGPGNSLLEILSYIKSSKVVISLGDTFIKGLDLNNLEDQLIVSKDFLSSQRWATVIINENDEIDSFHDKEKIEDPDAFAICGVYALNDISILKKFVVDENGQIGIVKLLEFYQEQTDNLTICNSFDWLDFGHIDRYYVSKKRLIQSRDFNSLEYDDLLGTITKRSKNVEKFVEEIKWQLNLPSNLKVLAPRVLNYSVDDKPFIEMEFYSYPTISEIWLFSELSEGVYFSIIDKVFRILDLFAVNKIDVPMEDYTSIYIEKTRNRVKEIRNSKINNYLEQDLIVINDKSYQNWSMIQEKIFKLVGELYNTKDNCFIHGDFCLSNILYDLRNGIARLIDPRGVWGSSENGDIKYDVAKLRHSICGDYDYIVNDLFILDATDVSISYNTINSDKSNIKEYFDQKVSEHYNLKQIKLIEGLLFLSMISLHSDNRDRQIVMYAKAIENLNSVI